MFSDVRYAARMIARTPVFAATVIVTIALAIAANTTVFSVVNAVMIRPFPYAEPSRLVQLAEKNDKLNLPSFGASPLNFIGWREAQKSFEEIAAYRFATHTITGSGGDPEQVSGNTISPALPRVLGMRLIAGRAFVDDEEKPGGAPVAILGEALWKRRFNGDKSILGQTVTIDGVPTTVVGIAPASLNLLTGGDLYTPLVIDPAKEIRLNHVLIVFGRLKSGVTLQQAQAEMNTISSRMAQQYPELRDWGIAVITLFDTFVSPQLKTALIVLLCAVGCVLLIACANVANLLLARAAVRQKEMAVRTALGASRGRLLRQLLIESLSLSLIGGIAGVTVAMSAMTAINKFLPPNLLPVADIKPDSSVLLYALGLTMSAGLLFGILPSWRMALVDPHEGLKVGGRESVGSVRARLRNALAGVEIGLATVLLIGAGLLIQTLAHLQRVPLGFQSNGLITFQVAPPPSKYPPKDRAPQFYRALLDSLRSAPGVKSAAVSSGVPFGQGNYTSSPVTSIDNSVVPQGGSVQIDWRIASPGYFKTMDIPLLRGREFTDADREPAHPTLIVSQATAKKLWGDGDPIGRRIYRIADPQKLQFTVVGVVGDVRNTALNLESPTLYYSTTFRLAGVMDVVVRTDGSPEALVPALRHKVHELDGELALANVRTMDDYVSTSAAQPRLNAILLGSFAVIALLIAAGGIYGVLAYSVNQRTREIGVRMALGAQPGDVLRLVVREGMRVALIGVGAGLLCGIVLGRVIASLLYGVAVHDPATFSSVAAVLLGVALAACAIPARRAARVDPMVALRYE